MTTTTFYGMEIATELKRKANESNAWEDHFPTAATSFDSTRNAFDLEDLCQASNIYAWWKPNTGCHHEEYSYIMRSDSRARKPGKFCQFCSMASKSALEGEVFEYIRSITPSHLDVLVSMRILPTGPGVSSTEIDIYLPQLRLGFEVNGKNHGAVKYYPSGYHESKVLRAETIGISLHHIWYKDMRDNKEETFSHIQHLVDQALNDNNF